MTAAARPPGLVLHLPRSGADGRTASVTRVGPTDLVRVGIGRPAVDAPALAALLFPVCPAAQAGAAAIAVERAMGLAPTPAVTAARNAVILAEAVVGCIWRMALDWPTLVTLDPDTAIVRSARAAQSALPQALFGDGRPAHWARPGGRPIIRRCGADVRLALTALSDAVRTLTSAGPPRAPMFANGNNLPQLPRPLGTDIGTAALMPHVAPREETPRSLWACSASPSLTLNLWFEAQAEHADRCMDALDLAVAEALSDADQPPQPEPNPTGVGLGVVTTARGRLRHAITVQDGAITGWTAAAPTDWNFAAQGPVVQMANRLLVGNDRSPADQEAAARWLVAAFDPCAPCRVTIGPSHA